VSNIKHIQSFKLENRPGTVAAWVWDMLIPGKDHIDVSYDEKRNLFMYSYRGQSDFDVASIRIPNVEGKMLEEGDFEVESTLEDKPVLGESLLCNLIDNNRGVVVTVFKGVSSGGIDVHLA